MANEAELKVRIENPVPYTIADGTDIAKGALLKLTDTRTAIISSSGADMIAGFAAREKVANDGRTELAVFMRGFFRVYCSGVIKIGQAISSVINHPNFVAAAGATTSGAAIIGHMLEAAGGNDRHLAYVNIGAGGNQVS